MKTLWLILGLISIAACTTHPHSEGRDQYVAIIDKHSAGDKQFSGVYQNFEFRTTLLNREVSQALHDRLAKFYDWGPEEASEKLGTRMSELDNQTKLWLSFFTQDSKNDNLSNKSSIWKIYLVSDSGRYEGRAIKTNMNFAEAEALIHYHNRWSTSYYLLFPVPTDQIQGENIKLVITGPLGRREVTLQ